MCGRFTLKADPEELAEVFPWLDPPRLRARYNIAPTDEILAVRQAPEPLMVRWGLIPWWTRGEPDKRPLINARAETAHRARPFRDAFKERRCLIPASGFYEWRREGKARQPYYITAPDGKPLAFAGLYDRWRPVEGEPVRSACILTTDANARVREIHDRMPVILSPGQFQEWLSPDTPVDRLRELLEESGREITMHPVSQKVNKVANDDADCIAPLTA